MECVYSLHLVCISSSSLSVSSHKDCICMPCYGKKHFAHLCASIHKLCGLIEYIMIWNEMRNFVKFLFGKHYTLSSMRCEGCWCSDAASVYTCTRTKIFWVAHLVPDHVSRSVYWFSRCDWLEHDCLLASCLASRQHASVPRGRICSDKFTCCHTEIEVTE